MMAQKKLICLKKLDVEVDFEDPIEGVTKVISMLRPEWKTQDLVIQVLPGGNINKMVVVFPGGDHLEQPALVVRVGESSVQLLVPGTRQKEIAALALASSSGCGPHLHAVLNNAIVYEYAIGNTVAWKDMSDDTIIRNVTRCLATFHDIRQEDYDVMDDVGEHYHIPEGNPLSVMIPYMMALWPEEVKDADENRRFQELSPYSQEDLQKEVAYVRGVMESLHAQEVLCHNDFNNSNLVVNQHNSNCTLLDYEAVGFNTWLDDLRFLFHKKAIQVLLGCCTLEDPDLTDSTRWKWVRGYLEACAERDGGKASDVTDERVQETFISFEKYAVASSLLCAVCLICNPHPEMIKVGSVKLGIMYYQMYEENKYKLRP